MWCHFAFRWRATYFAVKSRCGVKRDTGNAPLFKATPRRSSLHTFFQASAASSIADKPCISYHPSGRYLRTIKGIFFWFSSLIAICKGSVSPSKSTRTGAFMLPKSDRLPGVTLCFSYLICNARVPRTLARSYLVMYGVVVLLSSGIFLSASLEGFCPAC